MRAFVAVSPTGDVIAGDGDMVLVKRQASAQVPTSADWGVDCTVIRMTSCRPAPRRERCARANFDESIILPGIFAHRASGKCGDHAICATAGGRGERTKKGPNPKVQTSILVLLSHMYKM